MFIWLLLASLFCTGTQERNDRESGVAQCGPRNMTEQHSKSEQKIFLTWEDDPSCSANQDLLIYEVQVLRAGSPVHDDSVVVTAEQIGSTHSWSWISSLAFECVSHSFRLRSRYKNHTSPWSQMLTIPRENLSRKPQVFPRDRMVQVGTSLTFCCILDAGRRFDQMQVQGYNSNDMKATKISNQTYALTVDLNIPSETSCTNVICNRHYGACVYVGYPPADWGLQCETRDLQSVECHWNLGRETYLIKSPTVYRLIGRQCSGCNPSSKKCSCKQKVSVNVGEGNWTLAAKNWLGTLVLTERADLTKRVRMLAPENVIASSVNARNASLEWRWTVEKYNQLDLLCQIQLSHGGQTDRRNCTGIGLRFAVLHGLIPSQTYTVEVQCGTKQHFWTWGNLSTTTFQTKDDIPDALDVWMLLEQNQTILTWKPLLANQSHGRIIDYEVTWGKTAENEKGNRTRIFPPKNSVALRLDAGEEHVVTVTARNLNGSSSPSAITVPSLYPDRVTPSKITGTDGGFHVSWSTNPAASCGYVVAWCPTFSKCIVEWLKVPPGVTNARILSETFRPGVRYSLSIYACTQGAPKLLERREGYVREIKLQDKQIQGLKSEQLGSDVQVSWTGVSPQSQTAFIQGYIMYYDDSFHQNVSTDDPDATNLTARNLHAGTYTFKLKALTSIGECGDTYLTLTMDSLTMDSPDNLIMVIVSLVSVFSLLSLLSILCYRHWGCVKQKVFPPIPKPVLADNWMTPLGHHGRCLLPIDPHHHSEIEIVHVPELYRKLAPVNSNFSQEEEPLVAPQTQTPKGYCNQPLRNRIPAPLTPTPETVSSPSGLPSVPFRGIFENPAYNMVMQTEENSIWSSMDSASHPSPELQHETSSERNSSDYQSQGPMETFSPPQTEDDPEGRLPCDFTYIIPDSSSK